MCDSLSLCSSWAGQPCNADFLIHTEAMGEDWQKLLREINWPPTAVPHSNPTAKTQHGKSPPAQVFTQKVLNAINVLEANMFEEFSYTMRTDAPFEL